VREKRGCCEELVGRSDSRAARVCIGSSAGFKVSQLYGTVPVPPVEA